MYSERTQVLLSPEQRARLERIAADRRISVGAVIREAVDAFTVPRRKPPRDAFERLIALGAPVGDWQTMKQEIERGATGGPSLTVFRRYWTLRPAERKAWRRSSPPIAASTTCGR
jgi:hypothetical protein